MHDCITCIYILTKLENKFMIECTKNKCKDKSTTSYRHTFRIIHCLCQFTYSKAQYNVNEAFVHILF